MSRNFAPDGGTNVSSPPIRGCDARATGRDRRRWFEKLIRKPTRSQAMLDRAGAEHRVPTPQESIHGLYFAVKRADRTLEAQICDNRLLFFFLSARPDGKTS